MTRIYAIIVIIIIYLSTLFICMKPGRVFTRLLLPSIHSLTYSPFSHISFHRSHYSTTITHHYTIVRHLLTYLTSVAITLQLLHPLHTIERHLLTFHTSVAITLQLLHTIVRHLLTFLTSVAITLQPLHTISPSCGIYSRMIH